MRHVSFLFFGGGAGRCLCCLCFVCFFGLFFFFFLQFLFSFVTISSVP